MDFIAQFFGPLLDGSGGFKALVFICHLVVVALVLKVRSGWYFFSILRMVGRLFSAPVIWLRGQMDEVANIGEGKVTLPERDRSSLVRVVLFGLRVSIALVLTSGAGLGLALSLRACEPNEYAKSRVESLESEVKETESALEKAKKDLEAFNAAHPDLNVDDPRLAPAVAAKTVADTALATAETAFQTKVETVGREKEGLRYLLNSFVNTVDRLKPWNPEHVQRATNLHGRMCAFGISPEDCEVLRGVLNVWTAIGPAHVAAGEAEAEVRRLTGEKEKLRAEQKELGESVLLGGNRLSELKKDLDEAESKAGIQFSKGFTTLLSSGLSLLAVIWMLGLLFEFVMLWFRWMDDIAAIRERIETQRSASPPAAAPTPPQVSASVPTVAPAPTEPPQTTEPA